MGTNTNLGIALMGKQLNDLVANFAHALQTAAVIAVLLILATALDRRPPFAVLQHDTVPIKAGSYAVIDVPVWRDMSRDCDSRYSRHLFDASGSRITLNTDSYASAETIRKLETQTPGRMLIKFPVPPIRSNGDDGGVVPGLGSLDADLRYYCNKGHYLAPIQVRTSIPVLIVP